MKSGPSQQSVPAFRPGELTLAVAYSSFLIIIYGADGPGLEIVNEGNQG